MYIIRVRVGENMKRKGKILWCIGIICLTGSYGAFLHYYNQKDAGEAPVISFDNERIEISVNDEESALLDGVKAYDKEDGDLSKEVFVESISAFDENKDRMVTCAVFDSNKHVTKAVRRIHYKDYTKPKIYLKDKFMSNIISNADVNKLLGAVSCVDGDISNRITIQLSVAENINNYQVNVSVKDSTGEISSLDLIYNLDRNIYTTDILLKEYLVYIKVGETFDANANIEEIKSHSVNKEQQRYLYIDNQVNNQVPGVYEVKYSFNNLGDNGLTKCIVVVEE